MARLEGVEDFEAALKRLGTQLGQGHRAANARLANRVAAQMRASAPKETGRLAGSITVDTNAGGGGVEVVVEAPYAGFVEYGTRRMGPQPFARPAAAWAEGTLEAEMTTEIAGRFG